jgi:hypothetical protein
MYLTNKLLGFDALHARIDLQRMPTYLLTILAAVAWGVLGSGRNVVLAIGLATVFLLIFRLTLSRLGASRLSSVCFSVLLLVLCRDLSLNRLAELALFGVVILLTLEYFKERTKVAAMISGTSMGLIAAGMDNMGVLVLFIFLFAVAMRVMWHAVVERLSKKHFILFAIKAGIASALAVGVFVTVNPYIHFDWGSLHYMSWPSISWGYWLVAGLLMIRGLWATLLLETDRSPLCRGLRIFFVVFGLALVGLAVLLRSVGTDLLSPQFFAKLQAMGLTTYSVELAVFAIYAGVLLMTAGIDRSLYKDTPLARKVRSLE